MGQVTGALFQKLSFQVVSKGIRSRYRNYQITAAAIKELSLTWSVMQFDSSVAYPHLCRAGQFHQPLLAPPRQRSKKTKIPEKNLSASALAQCWKHSCLFCAAAQFSISAPFSPFSNSSWRARSAQGQKMEKRSENHPICMKWKFVWNHWKSPDLRAKEISQAGDVLNSGLESVLELNLGDCLQIQKFPKSGIPTFQSFAHSDGFLRFSLIPNCYLQLQSD